MRQERALPFSLLLAALLGAIPAFSADEAATAIRCGRLLEVYATGTLRYIDPVTLESLSQ